MVGVSKVAKGIRLLVRNKLLSDMMSFVRFFSC